MTQPESIKRPPGPPHRMPGGNLLAYRRDPLNFLMQNARDYGDLITLKFAKWYLYQINHPDLIQQVLVKQASSFHKSIIYKKTLSEYLGNGLLISDGDYWRRQRRLAQPAFHTQRIHTYADIMVSYAQRMVDSWQPGETRNIADDMMKLTLYIVAKTLFDTDVSGDSDRVGEALEVLLHSVIEQSQIMLRLPEWVPTPARRRKRWSIDTLHQVVMSIIQQRRADPVDHGDLLSMLMLSEDDSGERMSDAEVRDEALTIFLAGHETTANALTWTVYLLSQHPAIESKLVAELESVLQGRTPSLEDVPNLRYTEQVIKESMRLYPPAWSMGRQTIEPVELGGYTIPPRHSVIIIPYVTHRDPRFFPDPDRFDPDRFLPENEKAMHRYAYLPFGGGPRICIGNGFALMEAKLILATVLQRYRLPLIPSHPVEPEALVTLRPRHGMSMQIQSRQPVPQAGD